MRPLLILSEARQKDEVSEVIHRYGHPSACVRFIQQIEIDLRVDVDAGYFQYEIMKVLHNPLPDGAQHGYVVCATHDIEKALKLKGFLGSQNVEYAPYNAKELAKKFPPVGPAKPQLAKILISCGLDIHSAALSILSAWTHSRIDHTALTVWKSQFGKLGKLSWIADVILAKVSLMDAPELGEFLMSSPVEQADIAAYNKDGGGVVKSGEILANLLTKRRPSLRLLDSPADAIMEFPTGRVVVVEDGLWSGTETIGVLDSLRGLRGEKKLKTKPLSDPTKINGVSLTLAFGMSTDYGEAMVKRYLNDAGLGNISLFSANTLRLASSQLLANIADPTFKIEDLRKNGPTASEVSPFFLEGLEGVCSPDECGLVRDFCTKIGRQLLVNYLDDMHTRKGWDMWANQRLDNCSLGMHGLGLAHAFGHSVPKASLPLLWGGGTVEWDGKKTNWNPLFKNA